MSVNRVAEFFRNRDAASVGEADIDLLFESVQTLHRAGIQPGSMRSVPGTPRSEEVLLISVWLAAAGQLSLNAVKRFHHNEFLLTRTASLGMDDQERLSVDGATVQVYRGRLPDGGDRFDAVPVAALTVDECELVFTYNGPLIGDLMAPGRE